MIKYYIIFLFIGFGFSQDDSLGLDIIRMKSDITYKGVIIESSKTQVILKNRKNNEILKLSRKNIENISTPWSRGEKINKVSKGKRIDVNRNNEMKDFQASDIWKRGFSRGFLSEKNPFSFFEWSLLCYSLGLMVLFSLFHPIQLSLFSLLLHLVNSLHLLPKYPV